MKNKQKILDKVDEKVYNIITKLRKEGTKMQANEKKIFEPNEEEQEKMTNAQLNAFLESLAKLVEAKAETVEQAAEIVRQAKTE